MKTYKQLIEDIGVLAANTTNSVLPDTQPVVNKKAQKKYKKENSKSQLNIGSRKVRAIM